MNTRSLGLPGSLLLTLLAGGFVAPAPALAYPVALGAELDLSSDDAAASLPAVGHGGHGSFVVVWRTQSTDGDSIRGRLIQRLPAGLDSGPEFVVRSAIPGVTLSAPGVAMDANGRFSVVWGEAHATTSCIGLRRYGAQGQPLPSPTVEPCRAASSSPVEAPAVAAAANAGGEVGIAWTRRTGPGDHTVLLRTMSPADLLRPVAIVAPQAGPDPRPRAAVGGGQVFIVWQNPRALVRRFSIAGTPLAAAAQLPAYGGYQPAVAANRNGQFTAVWAEGGGGERSTWVGGWILAPDGSRLPRGFLDPLDYDALFPDGDVFNPDIASDRVGGLVFLWESELYDAEATAIVGRVYNSLGDQLSPIFRVNTEEVGAQRHPAVTLADDGAFLTAWESPPASDQTVPHVHAALLRMPHDDDPCVYRGNTFLCEFLGNFILAAPIQFGTGIANGDRPLLGDLDGDGRADPCLRRGGQFLCDLAHDGGAAEQRIVFGPAGAPALLADVDGNGSADPCVRTDRTFLCDTAHNGGTAELHESLGLASDLPVAGDVDGDGRADFCLARGAKLFCDRHTGVLELRSLSTRLNDWLLLGNVDGM